jgi:hypothetical protein
MGPVKVSAIEARELPGGAGTVVFNRRLDGFLYSTVKKDGVFVGVFWQNENDNAWYAAGASSKYLDDGLARVASLVASAWNSYIAELIVGAPGTPEV